MRSTDTKANVASISLRRIFPSLHQRIITQIVGAVLQLATVNLLIEGLSGLTRQDQRTTSESAEPGRFLQEKSPNSTIPPLERIRGIEPRSTGWKPVALPLSYIRKITSLIVAPRAHVTHLRGRDRAHCLVQWLR